MIVFELLLSLFIVEKSSPLALQEQKADNLQYVQKN